MGRQHQAMRDARLLALVLALLLLGTGCTSSQTATTDSPPSTPLAPSGGWLAYQSVSSRGPDGIFLVRPDGTHDHEILLGVEGKRLHPDFSRDGRMLAFDQSDGGTNQLYVSSADGTQPRLLAPCLPASCIQRWEPSWSPDGTRLAIATTMPGALMPMGIAIVDVKTGVITQVEEHSAVEGQDHFPRWSPDGTRLVFWRGDASSERGDTAVFTIGADGTGLRQLTDTALVAGDPDYSPDGTRILFGTHPLLQYRSGQSELFTMAPDGSDQRQLTHFGPSGPRATQPRWSPDGATIVYTRTTQSAESRVIWQMDADGSDDRPLVDKKSVYTHPVLQPADDSGP